MGVWSAELGVEEKIHLDIPTLRVRDRHRTLSNTKEYEVWSLESGVWSLDNFDKVLVLNKRLTRLDKPFKFDIN